MMSVPLHLLSSAAPSAPTRADKSAAFHFFSAGMSTDLQTGCHSVFITGHLRLRGVGLQLLIIVSINCFKMSGNSENHNFSCFLCPKYKDNQFTKTTEESRKFSPRTSCDQRMIDP